MYGNATPLPAHEDAPSIVPESPYASSKRAAELIASAMLRKTPKMRLPALRFFTVYGPRQRPEMAITTFLRAILDGKPITVFGDGSMRRDFTHVEDIVRGVIAAADRAPEGLRVYNLGSGAPISLTDLVTAMGKAAAAPPRSATSPSPSATSTPRSPTSRAPRASSAGRRASSWKTASRRSCSGSAPNARPSSENENEIFSHGAPESRRGSV